MSQKSSFGNTSERPAWRPGVPHNDLPLIPPPIDLETRPVLKRCIGARVALLQGIEETAAWTTAKIGSIRQLMAAAVEHIRTTTPKIYRRELVDLVFEQPYCRIANVVEAGIGGRQAASRYLKALVSSGLLREQESGRDKLFVNSRLLTLLTAETDAFEPFRSGRRDGAGYKPCR